MRLLACVSLFLLSYRHCVREWKWLQWNTVVLTAGAGAGAGDSDAADDVRMLRQLQMVSEIEQVFGMI